MRYMAVILQSPVNIFGLALLDIVDAVVNWFLGFDVDQMSYFLLSDSNNSPKRLLFRRLVPPWVDDNHSIGNGKIERLIAALQSQNL